MLFRSYAGSFVPSWAGAIAIDLLPAVLVLILMVVQAAIRAGREPLAVEQTLTLAELQAALLAVRDVEDAMEPRPAAPAAQPMAEGADAPAPQAPDSDEAGTDQDRGEGRAVTPLGPRSGPAGGLGRG